jgi:hypothetical protein
MSTCRSRLSRFKHSNCEQIMPVPVVSIFGLPLSTPQPLYPQPPFPPGQPPIDTMSIWPYPPVAPILPVPGMIFANSTGTIPTGYLLCDGSEVSRDCYEMLFHVIGTYYGEGNRTTTFNVPNLSNDCNSCVQYMITCD